MKELIVTNHGVHSQLIGFGTGFRGRHFPKLGLVMVSCTRISKGRAIVLKCSVSAPRPASQPRFIQHKQEAFWFYRFLSIVYGPQNERKSKSPAHCE